MKKIVVILSCGLFAWGCSGKSGSGSGGGSSNGPKLYVQGGTLAQTSGTDLAVFDAVVADGTGAPLATDYTVTLTPPGGGQAVSFDCTTRVPSCFYTDALPTSGQYTATAIVNGKALSTQFTMSGNALGLPQGSATASGSTVTAQWSAVSGAQSYVVSVVDAQGNLASTTSLSTTNTSGTLTLAAGEDPSTGSLSLVLMALSFNPFGTPSVPPIAPAGGMSVSPLGTPTPGNWTFYGPSNYSGGTLTVSIPALAANEQVAVIAINTGTVDGATAQLSLTGTNPSLLREGPGTSAPVASRSVSLRVPTTMSLHAIERRLARGPRASTSVTPSWLLELRHEAELGHARIRAQEAKAMAPFWAARSEGKDILPVRSVAVSTVAPDTTSFCVLNSDQTQFLRRPASKVFESNHMVFYVDDQDSTHYQSYPDIWQTLDTDWENDIYPEDTKTFGSESDVDGNQKLIVFFTDALGAAQSNGGIVLGYYYSPDVTSSLDTTTDCTGTGSNHADMFYMNDLQNVMGAGYPANDAINQEYPSTLAHEFQHLINFNQHILVSGGLTPEDTWINEGLSKVAEDITGFGWNNDRSDLSGYFAYFTPTTNVPYTRYFNSSFANWDGDPIGDYAGVHSFFRYFVDRMGKGILTQIDSGPDVGVSHLVGILGESDLDHAMADWTTALIFGNEPFSPDPKYDFAAGAPWTPLYQTVSSASRCTTDGYPGHGGYVGYEKFDSSGNATANLRQYGWNAFVSGTGTGADATLTVTAPTGEEPDIVLVRFSGSLPDGSETCP